MSAIAHELLATVSRGGAVESSHYGAAVLVRAGEPVWSIGTIDAPVWTRSVTKPFQAIASLQRGLDTRAELTNAELAVISSSHDSTPEHVETVRSLLAKLGSTEEALLCGPHASFDRRASLAIARSGGKPQRIHNNCSGKHAAMLWLARECGVDPARYLEPDSASQLEVRDVVAEFVGVEPGRIAVAIDGCGAPTFGLPLVHLAVGFSELMNPRRVAAVRADACKRLHSAITASPLLYAGRERLCTALLRASPGRVWPKNGAEGLYACGFRDDAGEATASLSRSRTGRHAATSRSLSRC